MGMKSHLHTDYCCQGLFFSSPQPEQPPTTPPLPPKEAFPWLPGKVGLIKREERSVSSTLVHNLLVRLLCRTLGKTGIRSLTIALLRTLGLY